MNKILSLLPIKLVAMVTIGGPWLAIFSSYYFDEQLLGLTADAGLFYNYSIFFACSLVLVFLTRSDFVIYYHPLDKVVTRKYLNRILVVSLLSFCFVLIFSGIDILTGKYHRGEIRTQLGFVGPIFTFIIKFVLPSIVFGTVLIDIYAIEKRYRLKQWLIYALVAATCFITGYKALMILVFMPAFSYLLCKVSSVRYLLLAASAITVATVSDFMFHGTEGSLLESLAYVYARSTIVAAYGVLGAWDFTVVSNFEAVPAVIFAVLGSSLSVVVLKLFDYQTSQVVGDYGKLVTMQYYPDTQAAEEGTVNLTITLFGELVSYSRTFWLLGFIVFVLVVYLTIKYMRKRFSSGQLSLGVLAYLIILMVFLPIINSSGLFSIVSIPVMIYIAMSFILLRFIIPSPIRTFRYV